jgi:hypothetical protein
MPSCQINGLDAHDLNNCNIFIRAASPRIGQFTINPLISKSYCHLFPSVILFYIRAKIHALQPLRHGRSETASTHLKCFVALNVRTSLSRSKVRLSVELARTKRTLSRSSSYYARWDQRTAPADDRSAQYLSAGRKWRQKALPMSASAGPQSRKRMAKAVSDLERNALDLRFSSGDPLDASSAG